VDFGSVVLGDQFSRHFLILNQTRQGMILPAISIQGSDFSLAAPSPSGVLFAPARRPP